MLGHRPGKDEPRHVLSLFEDAVFGDFSCLHEKGVAGNWQLSLPRIAAMAEVARTLFSPQGRAFPQSAEPD